MNAVCLRRGNIPRCASYDAAVTALEVTKDGPRHNAGDRIGDALGLNRAGSRARARRRFSDVSSQAIHATRAEAVGEAHIVKGQLLGLSPNQNTLH